MDKSDSRYPYTYAADYLRERVRNDDGSLLSRSVMAHVQQVIADAMGMENKLPISQALADKFIEANVKEHATPLAGAGVETGVEVHTTGDVADKAASGGCCGSSCSPCFRGRPSHNRQKPHGAYCLHQI